MKSIIGFTVLLVMVAILSPRALAQGELKIGIVDMARVFADFHKTKAAEKELEDRKEKVRGEVEERGVKLKEMAEDLKTLSKSLEDPVLNPELRQSRQKKLQVDTEEAAALEGELREFVGRREMQLMEMFNRKRDVILEELQAAVSKMATEAGYDLVFDKSARSTRDVPFLLYSKDAKDFSAELISQLNAGAPALPAASSAEDSVGSE